MLEVVDNVVDQLTDPWIPVIPASSQNNSPFSFCIHQWLSTECQYLSTAPTERTIRDTPFHTPRENILNSEATVEPRQRLRTIKPSVESLVLSRAGQRVIPLITLN